MNKKSIPVRILTALCGVTLLALAAGVVAEGFFGIPVTAAAGKVLASRQVLAVLVKLLGVLALAVLAVAAMICALPCRKPKQTDSIMQKGDHGTFGITVNAIKKMVLACAAKHPEIIQTDVSVREVREGIVILMNVEQAGGVSIPLSIDLLQKQVSQYVKGRTGLDVAEVRVMVDNVSDDHVSSEFEVEDTVVRTANVVRTEDRVQEASEPGDQLMALQHLAQITQQIPAEEPEAPATTPMEQLEAAVSASEQLDEILPVPQVDPEVYAEEEKPLHQRVFGAEEEPVTVAMPPEMQPEVHTEPAEEPVTEPEAEEAAEPEAEETPADEMPEEDWTAPSMQAAADAVLTGDAEPVSEETAEADESEAELVENVEPEAETIEKDEEKPVEEQSAP